jgi:uncharacterized protein
MLNSGGVIRILVIHDGNKGHLKQSLTLMEILKLSAIEHGASIDRLECSVIEARFKSWSLKAFIKVFNPYLSPRHPFQQLLLPACMTPESLEEIMVQTPDIIISCGAAGSGVSTMLKKKTCARNVVILNPGFVTRDDFDLVIMPHHDLWSWKPFGSNVIITDLALNPVTPERLRSAEEERSAASVAAVNLSIGLLVGGNNRSFRFTSAITAAIASGTVQLCTRLGAQLHCTTSRRTPRAVDAALEQAFVSQPFCQTFIKGREDHDPDTVQKILASSDLLIVSGESISMVSEAIASGRPVVVFMPQKVLPVYTKYERFVRYLVAKGYVIRIRAEEIGGLKIEDLVRPAENPAMQDSQKILAHCRPFFN